MMRTRLMRFGVGIGLVLLAFLVACTGKEAISISQIASNPAKYDGTTVVLTGEYRGWEAGYGSPPVTRSDWVLKDATGAIYITGKTPAGFDPAGDIGQKVTVAGTVRVKDSKAYIAAETVSATR